MVRMIDAEKYMELLKEQYLHNMSMHCAESARAWQGAMQLLYDMPTLTPPNEPRMINADKLAKRIAGHSNYHGDSILAAIYCAAEGKENDAPIRSIETPPNEPLTLEQLREMDEILIYVVTKKYGSGWCVLNWHGVKKSYTYFSRTGTSEGMTATPLSAKTYGDLWIAYRRPPEGEEDA